MSTNSPDLMQMLKSEMRYSTQRQKVLAENVANIDTPGYKAKDLKKVDFGEMVNNESQRLTLRETSPTHLPGTLAKSGSFAVAQINSEQTTEMSATGNDVDLESQMANISETQTQHELAGSLFKKFTSLYRAALGR